LAQRVAALEQENAGLREDLLKVEREKRDLEAEKTSKSLRALLAI